MWRSENYIINTTTGNLKQDKEIDAISTALVLLMVKVTTFLTISLRHYFYNFIHLKKSDDCYESKSKPSQYWYHSRVNTSPRNNSKLCINSEEKNHIPWFQTILQSYNNQTKISTQTDTSINGTE